MKRIKRVKRVAKVIPIKLMPTSIKLLTLPSTNDWRTSSNAAIMVQNIKPKDAGVLDFFILVQERKKL